MKGENFIIFVNFAGRNFAGNDFAKKAIRVVGHVAGEVTGSL